MNEQTYTCLVCGYPGLEEEPIGSWNICPCCGVEFEYHQSRPWEDYRKDWIDGGCKWWSTHRLPPPGWSPTTQLRAAGHFHLTIHVKAVKVVDDYSLELTFNNGMVKRVNLQADLWGPITVPLLDPAYFAQVFVDDELGTIAWPNSFDYSPDGLFLMDEEAVSIAP